MAGPVAYSRVGDCCERGNDDGGGYDAEGYSTVFGDRFARRLARRYKRRGLSRSAGAIATFVTTRDIAGATVLEIGGGVGDLHVELLRRGAARATNLEISNAYEPEARALLERGGMRDRVQRRRLDIAQSPDEVEAADIVVLHRVVCCYPDYLGLLTAAGSKANRLLVFSHPPRNLASRTVIACDNAWRRLRGNSFRAFVHPPDQMMAALTDAGLRPTYHWRGFGWCVVGLER
jgi:16S rRNA G966 N2-methylase RsmD